MLAPSATTLQPFATSCFSIFKEELVLSCTRKSDVNRNLPYAAAFVVFRLWSVFLVFCQTCTLYFFDLFQSSDIDAFRIIYQPVESEHVTTLDAQLLSLLNSVNSNITGT